MTIRRRNERKRGRAGLYCGLFSAIAALLCALPGGCDAPLGGIPSGTYSGELACTIVAADPPAEAEYAHSGTLTIEPDGDILINGEDIVVGDEVLRSIPTADLAFEIIEVTQTAATITIRYAPHPTLSGITVEGELTETYEWNGTTIDATADADLIVTDIDGPVTLTVECDGTLQPINSLE